jgi:hypothetical protein
MASLLDSYTRKLGRTRRDFEASGRVVLPFRRGLCAFLAIVLSRRPGCGRRVLKGQHEVRATMAGLAAGSWHRMAEKYGEPVVRADLPIAPSADYPVECAFCHEKVAGNPLLHRCPEPPKTPEGPRPQPIECPTFDELSAWIEQDTLGRVGPMAPERVREIQHHVAGCKRCEDYEDGYLQALDV